MATNADSSRAPKKVEWTTTDAAVLSRLFQSQTLNFAVQPTAPNGSGIGEVSVDYAEVTLKYRLP